MEQFEQLLTCCVCLDRYRNPKLLPCQHSFCMEPCMEGLVDYVRRQVKCPECRAEHRIPYQGVQAFPTNVTLQRFLELHIEITGELPDPTSGQIMERCNVCSEKAYLSHCAHCDKKICEDCKSAHMDIMRREITRINSQIRRSLHRLQDFLAVIEKNTISLQSNCVSVSEEIDEIYRRVTKAIKDRSEQLKSEIDRYLLSEIRSLISLKENLELEITNIQSNCDVADKHMNENVEWDDCELMDTKEIFLKTVEFLRNFEYENTDYSRRVRFLVSMDPNQLVMNLATFGDLNITSQSATGSQSSQHLLVPQQGLMRSKSDHRLTTQFRQQDERGYDNEPVLGGRKFGERPQRNTERYSYNRGGDDYDDFDNDPSRPSKPRFRSRFVRSHQNDDSDNEPQRNNRQNKDSDGKDRDKVLDTEDVSRGQLSGIIRLSDCPRVLRRLQDQGREKKEKKVESPKSTIQPPTRAVASVVNRQISEDDEISRIKRQNKGSTAAQMATASSTTTTTTTNSDAERPTTNRVAALKKNTTSAASNTTSEESDSSHRTSPSRRALSKSEDDSDSEDESDSSSQQPKPPIKKTNRSNSTDSSGSTESSNSNQHIRTTAANSAQTRFSSPRDISTARGRSESVSNATNETKKPFVSRFLPQHTNPVAENKNDKFESSSEEETSSEESEEEIDKNKKPTTNSGRSTATPSSSSYRELMGRKTSREEPSLRPSYTTSTVSSNLRSRAVPAPHHTSNDDDRYNSAAGSSYSSRFLNRSKSTHSLLQGEYGSGNGEDLEVFSSTGRSRYLAMKDRRNRLARSRSSHTLGNDDGEDFEDTVLTTASPSAYVTSRYNNGSSYSLGPSELSRSRSSHTLKSREGSPGGISSNKQDGEALSSWARYLKNKYGNRTSKDSRDASTSSTSNATPSSSTSSATTRRLSLGLPLRQASEIASSDDDSKNGLGSPTSPTVAAGITGVGTSPKTLYLRKRQQLFQLGGRGSEPGSFTWPRGIAVGPDNCIVVADSSNHRVQVFDSNGMFVKQFGEYGNGDGEFDCLAGVAVTRIGQYIIADRYNHRIQILDPQGRFLRSFGSQGTSDGKFNYPWGVTTDALGFIYVCDKENHRVQVFQSDGTFVGKFGTCGRAEGQLEHPHYIAVSNTNRVIVSDSNNHRIQIFDVNGKVLSTFGGEGSDEGQFKFPRGVAVDDQGYIVVADSGNNRIQIFNPDGSFLKTFGSWGSGDCEFKGLEGVSIMSNGNILVCDRENHRIQVF